MKVFCALGVEKEGLDGRSGVWFCIVAFFERCGQWAWMICERFGKRKKSELQEQRFR